SFKPEKHAERLRGVGNSSGDENGSDSMKYWEIIADRLHAEGWSYGIAEHLTKHGVLFCVDAHRDGKRFIVKADDLLTAFLSLERDLIVTKGAAPAVILRFLLSEVACQGGSVVAVADGENLAVSLNKYSVNRGNAVAEWGAYKSAVTERRVQCSVGGIARQ